MNVNVKLISGGKRALSVGKEGERDIFQREVKCNVKFNKKKNMGGSKKIPTVRGTFEGACACPYNVLGQSALFACRR